MSQAGRIVKFDRSLVCIENIGPALPSKYLTAQRTSRPQPISLSRKRSHNLNIRKMVLHKVAASTLPSSWKGIKDRIPQAGDVAYIFFIVDNDTATGKPWCPDVREALPIVETYFQQRSDLDVSVVSVGSRAVYVVHPSLL